MPKGYEKGKTKYVVVTGSVISGLGKGIFASALGLLLENHGLSVSPIKFDGYLNVDAGTLNPFRHGEVFVLNDGTECDMDLGTYERFLHKDLTKSNYMTAGKLFKSLLERERKGGFLGRDVQIIPHVTGEIKRFIRKLSMEAKADVVLIEIGGTVGDLENGYFIEAMRELAYEEGDENVCFVNLTYILNPKTLGEQKSKAAQLGIRALMGMGIMPDIIACRAGEPVGEKIREKISIFSNVPIERVISLHDVPTIYMVPVLLNKEGIGDAVIKRLGLKDRVDPQAAKEKFVKWEEFVSKIMNGGKTVTIGMAGKYTGLADSYASILKALEHAGAHCGAKVKVKWIETSDIEKGAISVDEVLKGIDGLIVAPGFGARGVEGKIECVRYVRENKIPFLGICYGLQMAVIEHARNVLGLEGANSTEVEPECKHPVIDVMPEQKKIHGLGGNMRLGIYPATLKEGTKVFELYGKKDVTERHRHRWEVNPKYIEKIEMGGLVFSGQSPDRRLMEFIERTDHPYFVATQAHPEFKSRPLKPAPLFMGLIKAAVERKKG